MRHVVWLLLAFIVALPEAARGDAFKDLNLFRPGRAMATIDFTVPDVAGSPLRLAAFKGQVVFLNFWATWCPPCREEAPVLSRAHERLRRSGGTVVGLSMDVAPLPGVARVARRLGMQYPIALAPPGSAESFQVDVLPTSYLIDATGKIRWSYVGGLTDREISSALDRLTAVD